MPCPRAASSSGSRLACSSLSSRLTLASRPFCAETASTCAGDRPSRSAESVRCAAICSCTCSGELSASHMVSILLSTTSRASGPWPSPARCWRQIVRSDLVTPASAARMNTTACACGRRLTVNSGSAPMALRPGVSRITRPCLSSGCAMLIRAWRHLGTSISPSLPSGGLSSGVSSFQKPSDAASAGGTRRTSATFWMARASCCGSLTSRSMRSHLSGALRQSCSDWGCRRVSIGNRRRQGGTSASYPSSVGHMVVRPALAGMIRRP